jgi:hypothetical protein
MPFATGALVLSVRVPAAVLVTVSVAVPVEPVEHGLQLSVPDAQVAKVTLVLVTRLPPPAGPNPSRSVTCTVYEEPASVVTVPVEEVMVVLAALADAAVKVTVCDLNGVPFRLAVQVCVPATGLLMVNAAGLPGVPVQAALLPASVTGTDTVLWPSQLKDTVPLTMVKFDPSHG